MDWATDHAWTVPARWAAIILGLVTCGAELGCGRMNSFLRDEPPMLGATNSPTATTAKVNASAPSGTRAATTARGLTGRPSPLTDLFGRTQPRSAASPATTSEESGAATAPLDPGKTPENGVRPTALAASPDAGNSPGVRLKPPVSMPTSPGSPSPGPSAPPDPTDPTTSPNVSQPENLSPSSSAVRDRVDPVVKNEDAHPTTGSIIAAALQRLETLHSYQVAINRQERVGESLQEPEDVVLSIRRNPRAVRLQWREGPHKGREVLFSEQETQGLMQVNMADSAIPIPRLALPPDSPLILRTSRHPITEAGFETIVRNLQKTIEENQAGDHSHGQISYAGLEQPGPLDHPCHKLVRVTAAGETWQVFLDPGSKLPAMVQANAPNGDLLERYLFRDVHADPPELAAADAFDPKLRWGEPKGLLSRLAGAAAASAPASGAMR